MPTLEPLLRAPRGDHRPRSTNAGFDAYAQPAPDEFGDYRTFCGTRTNNLSAGDADTRRNTSMSLYAVVDPATGEVVKEYPTATDEQIGTGLAAAGQGLPRVVEEVHAGRPGGTDPQGRRTARRTPRTNSPTIIQREMGKALDQAVGEVEFSAAIYEYYADNAEKFWPTSRSTLLTAKAAWSSGAGPVGVLLGIMPWNYLVLPGGRFAGPNLTRWQHHRAQHAPQCHWSRRRRSRRSSTTPATRRAPTSTSTRPTSRSPRPSPTHAGRVSLTGSERAGGGRPRSPAAT